MCQHVIWWQCTQTDTDIGPKRRGKNQRRQHGHGARRRGTAHWAQHRHALLVRMQLESTLCPLVTVVALCCRRTAPASG